MKISNIKINGFGKIENQEFNFDKGFNLITGNNESGKSTFAKCLQGMFFGVSRNKNGNPISDYEKYKPWTDIPFSAKIDYTLDNGEQYEVFRDFNKRITKIFNSNLEDISANYTIDKAKNSNFFVEQTNISEDIFTKTAIIQQQEIKLDKSEQNVILQKLSNLVSTGDDTVSFKKLMDRLNRKQLDEIGTQRSSERPLNLVLNKIDECNSKLQDIDTIKAKDFSIKNELALLKIDLNNLEKEVALLKELLNVRNNERIEHGKIDAIKKVIRDYDEKISNVKKELNAIKAQNSKKSKLGGFFGVLGGVSIVLFFLLSLPWPSIIASVVLLGLSIYFYSKREKILDTQSVLQDAKKLQEQELDNLISQSEKLRLSSNDYIRNTYGNSDFLDLSYEEISNKLVQVEADLSEKRLKFNTLTVNGNNILTQLEEFATVEETLDSLNEELDELNFLNNSINIAKDALTEAYNEMKNSITPNFTNYLSSVISKISDGKYSRVMFNDVDGLTVQLSNGDYINCELLSIGTIDQMYISLRLAALKEVSSESLPIIFDEAFVYFDDIRLKNMLDFLNNEFEQIIIFSCSSREKDMLDALNISYTYNLQLS